MAASYRKSTGPTLPSPSGRFRNSPSLPASYSSSGFASSRSGANIYGSSSVQFHLDRCVALNRSIFLASGSGDLVKRQKKTCMCAPTTHPGSFRCSLHKSFGSRSEARYSPNRLNARRSAMTNSLVRIRGVEGDLVKRALAALIRPSLHNQRRRGVFIPRPSRLSFMSKAQKNS